MRKLGPLGGHYNGPPARDIPPADER
jgi:hypothetical protein